MKPFGVGGLASSGQRASGLLREFSAPQQRPAAPQANAAGGYGAYAPSGQTPASLAPPAPQALTKTKFAPAGVAQPSLPQSQGTPYGAPIRLPEPYVRPRGPGEVDGFGSRVRRRQRDARERAQAIQGWMDDYGVSEQEATERYDRWLYDERQRQQAQWRREYETDTERAQREKMEQLAESGRQASTPQVFGSQQEYNDYTQMQRYGRTLPRQGRSQPPAGNAQPVFGGFPPPANMPPPFQQTATDWTGRQVSPEQGFAQRNAFMQMVNDARAPFAASFPTAPAASRPIPVPQTWDKAGRMVQQGWPGAGPRLTSVR